MTADGKGRRLIEGVSGGWATWSPGGDRIALQGSALAPDGTFSCCAIWVTDLDGKKTLLSFHGREPDWSPDGSKIAFSAGAPPHPHHVEDLYVMNADGSGVTQLTDTQVRPERLPSWSPDSKMIAYEGGPLGSPEIWVMNADGTSNRRLTEGGRAEHPNWSPDGKEIAFWRPFRDRLSIVKVDGSGERKIPVLGGPPSDWQAIPGPRCRARGRPERELGAVGCRAPSGCGARCNG